MQFVWLYSLESHHIIVFHKYVLKHKIKPDTKFDLFKEGVTFEGLIRQQKAFS